MVNFPFYRYPYRYYYGNRPDAIHNSSYQTTNKIENDMQNITNIKEETKEFSKKNSRYNSIGPINFQNPFSANSEEPILEILGIKLYLDDIIILGLLFFLYNEGVKDEMLFLSLILLLLS